MTAEPLEPAVPDEPQDEDAFEERAWLAAVTDPVSAGAETP